MSRRPGRLLRQQWADDARETPERVAERIAYRQAADEAIAERERRYPVLTAENALEAIEFQAQEIQRILKTKVSRSR